MPERCDNFCEYKLAEFIDVAKGKDPVPGGGAMAACAAALGAAASAMAANFTLGRKKFKEQEKQVTAELAELEDCIQMLLECLQADSDEFIAVAEAYALDATNAHEKTEKTQRIKEALLGAMQPPLDALKLCERALAASCRLLPIANPMLLSDIGVAGALLFGAAKGVAINVMVNFDGLDSPMQRIELLHEIDALVAHCGDYAGKIELAIRDKYANC